MQNTTINNAVMAAIVAAASLSFNAEAALTSYTGANGAGMVYSSVSNVTWTKDANLYKTLNLTSNGHISLSTANAFISQLNASNYGGSQQWRLPTFQEQKELYQQELNGKEYDLTANRFIPNAYDVNNVFDNEEPSIYWTSTLRPDMYPRIDAWNFGSGSTYIGYGAWNSAFLWVVSSGQVAAVVTPSAVPVPAAAWLFGSGLVGLAGLRRKKQA
ncbi:Lcl domain-containing protein [Methylophilus aquaticus]|uniref:DUF1566 domain-containing protein n=1 Tax=Methylophilus aquaticus TaxID=1971610 RepID=A0ABT9JSS3_9PROT|nr:DUF1566 domain-containing protein [Methylophilus aquaticus]MDP8567576.1 DUF1566 domain-containing protein [Methylophilus aquaticus]